MSKEYDHFWKYHNKDNMDVHAVELIEKQAKRIKELEDEKEILRKTLYHELPEKYPDNCEVCKGANCGVRGNENIIDGVIMCDYCHAKTLKG